MPTSRKKSVTLLEIARASGVSLASVSLALSDKPGISKETRERVLAAARSLGYIYKPARPVPGKGIKTIGLLIGTKLEEEPYVSHFYSHIMAAIEATCQEMDISLMFANVPVNPDHSPIHIPPLLEKGDVDGLLLAGMIVERQIGGILERRALPTVLIESYSPERPYSAVLYDNFQGAYLATDYLLRRGHRDIGFVGGHASDYPSFRDRRAGYQKALADHQVAQAYFADFAVYPSERNQVIAATTSLVRATPQISALVCVNDDIAIAAMSGLSSAGIAVPQAVSVIGFDDIHMAASTIPALTTMRVNKQSMGRLAVQLLLNQTLPEGAECITSLFRPTLVERNSVVDHK